MSVPVTQHELAERVHRNWVTRPDNQTLERENRKTFAVWRDRIPTNLSDILRKRADAGWTWYLYRVPLQITNASRSTGGYRMTMEEYARTFLRQMCEDSVSPDTTATSLLMKIFQSRGGISLEVELTASTRYLDDGRQCMTVPDVSISWDDRP